MVGSTVTSGQLVRSAPVTRSCAISRGEAHAGKRRTGQTGMNRYHPCHRLGQYQAPRQRPVTGLDGWWSLDDPAGYNEMRR